MRLRRLEPSDVGALAQIGLDEKLWRFTPRPIRTRDNMDNYVLEALRDRDLGTAVPFVGELLETGDVAGCTRFDNIVPEHRRLVIGWTWIALALQCSAMNTEMKLLMFSYAFDKLGMNRIERKRS